MSTRKIVSVLVLALSSIPLVRADGIYALRDAKIVTVSGPIIEKGTVVIQDGLIVDVGTKVSIPRGAQVINARGLTVYPGLFDANTRIGLTEIRRVAATNDYSEMGEYMPHLLAFTAVHVESEHIPVARVNGITQVLTRPVGGTIPGQGAIISLEGWTPHEMEIRRHGAMLLDFPSVLSVRFSRRRYSEIKKEHEEKIRQLKELFAKARHYMQARIRFKPEEISASRFFPHKQLEALIPVLKGEQPVLIEANSHVDIKNAVKFAQGEKLNYILLGASDAWKVADFLKENKARVILGPRQSLPGREDDPIDIIYRTPAILHQHGVPFAIATGDSAQVRNLQYEAGNAVAYGLPYQAALRSITLTPAEFLGVAQVVGSIEKGKKANLVVAQGDILEYQTPIRHLFINGKPVSLETKHTRLYHKYLNRP
ncbi:amidohydrolase family protein [Acidobacteria bacterium AH-259-G07]|nr:amidohydrolase family protein [Acidobacteria bacterium AH-259-G07]